MKVANTWHATHAIQAAREACGGAGYLSENLLAGLKADTDVFTTFEGDNTVLLQLVAKGLLTDYKDSFQNLSPLATARFAAEKILGAVAERTSARKVVDRLTEPRRPRGPVRPRMAPQAVRGPRAARAGEGVADRLRKAGHDPFGVFNAAQDHVLRAGRVHVDRLVLEAFVHGIEQCPDPDAKLLLERVCDLYALANIEADRAWFLEHGRLSAGRSKAVVAAVNTLCGELRPHARTLVDAFAIPERYLAAPMLED